MASPGYGVYDTEQQDIENRRRYAEALQQQGMQQQSGGMAGRVYVAPSWTQGLAKVLQSYVGAKGAQDASDERKALSGRIETDRSTDMTAMVNALRGTPARPQQMGADDRAMIADQGGEQNPMIPAVPGDPNAAAMAALQSKFGDIRGMAPGLMNIAETRQNRGEDRAFREQQANQQREFQMQQLQMRAQDARASQQERLAAQQQLQQMMQQGREDNIRLAASMRPAPQPQSPVAVQDPNDPSKSIFVPPGQAAGMRPAPNAKAGPMSAAAQKELIETDEQIQGGAAALDSLNQARAINEKAMGGFGSGALATAGTILPDALRPATVDATQNLDNILQSGALPQLKAIFGGMPTEGERKILLDIQGSSSKPAAVRKDIFDRAQKAIEQRMKFSQDKAKSLRSGTYFTGDGGVSPQRRATDSGASGEWKDL